MHFIRGLVAIVGSVVFLLTLNLIVAAQIEPPTARPQRPLIDEPQFTSITTITVESGAALSTALYSRWSQSVISFPVGAGGFSFGLALPTDATEITASASNGDFAIVGTTVYFTLTSTGEFAYGYRTLQQVLRTGNQFRINQRQSSNTDFRQISTIYYPAPLQYVGSLTITPQVVTTGTLQWDVVVPLNDPPSRHLFQVSSWLVDPRLGQPDLSFTAAAMSIDSSLNPPLAQLTATVRNNNDVNIPSTNAILEFYDRASPSAPPGGPLDHAGGWCGSGTAPDCPILPTFANPIPSLAPGASVTVVMTYPLTSPGVRDYYFQIDTFGGSSGLNVEFNELNNVYSLTRGVTIDYLAGVAISGSLTGTADTPYHFQAQIAPTLAVNRPLTYTWSPTPLSGQGTANVTYTWSTGAPQPITVTARNAKQTVVTGTRTISIEVPLTGAVLTGPYTASLNVPHAYQVSAYPVTATQPSSYIWVPAPDQGQGKAVTTYTLGSLGIQTIAVSVGNSIGPVVTATHTVVGVLPLNAVGIDGPANGTPGTTYRFTAVVDPIDAALPIEYQWSPAPSSGQGTAKPLYHWDTLGTYAISVTVRNDSGPVTGTHTIVIATPLSSASIAGPVTVTVNIPHTYAASAQPPNATQPITYLWSPEPVAGQGTAGITLTLGDLGPHLLTVDVTNPAGLIIRATHAVAAVPALAAVQLDGPLSGRPHTTYLFTATLDPVNAAPSVYTWSPAPLSGQGTAYAAYRWPATGSPTISVTVRNDSGSAVAQHTIAVTGSSLYLPLIRK
jgi:hypothetical protein